METDTYPETQFLLETFQLDHVNFHIGRNGVTFRIYQLILPIHQFLHFGNIYIDINIRFDDLYIQIFTYSYILVYKICTLTNITC